MSETVRLSIKIPAELAEAIKGMADERSTTVTRIIRDAIETESILREAQRNRSRFLIEDETGRQREIVFR